jgi:hypothetical protein
VRIVIVTAGLTLPEQLGDQDDGAPPGVGERRDARPLAHAQTGSTVLAAGAVMSTSEP